MERKRVIDQIVCSFLYHRASHGYEIYELLNNNNIEKFMDFSKATIYNSLKRLDKNAMLDSKIVENDNKPSKTTYLLNNTGKEYLKELVEESLKVCKFETVFATNLGFNFHHLLDYDHLIELLENRLEQQKRIVEIVKPKIEASKAFDMFHLETVMEANLKHTEAEITKLEKILDKYKNNREYLDTVEEKVKKFTDKFFNENR